MAFTIHTESFLLIVRTPHIVTAIHSVTIHNQSINTERTTSSGGYNGVSSI